MNFHAFKDVSVFKEPHTEQGGTHVRLFAGGWLCLQPTVVGSPYRCLRMWTVVDVIPKRRKLKWRRLFQNRVCNPSRVIWMLLTLCRQLILTDVLSFISTVIFILFILRSCTLLYKFSLNRKIHFFSISVVTLQLLSHSFCLLITRVRKLFNLLHNHGTFRVILFFSLSIIARHQS